MYGENPEGAVGECRYCGLYQPEHCELCGYCAPTHAVDCGNGPESP
jgi:hypothetical protein